MKTRILITGASGYVGGHLVLRAPRDTEIFAVYHSQRPTQDYHSHWIEANLLDEALPSRLIKDVKPQVIIHCAALTKVDFCEQNPDLVNELNVEATDRLAAAAKAVGAKFIYLSTDLVFDGEHPPYHEDSPAKSNLVYGKTKLLGEQRTLSRSDAFVVARPSTIYGSEGISGTNLSLSLIERWKRNEVTPVFTDLVRMPVSIQWLIQVLYELSFSSFSGRINLGGAEAVSFSSFGHRLAKYLGFSNSLLTDTTHIGMLQVTRPRDTAFDLSLVQKSVLPNLPPLTLSQGFEREWQDKL